MATNNAINAPLPLAVTQGGQGNTTLAVDGILYGNGTAPVGVTAAGTTGQVLGGVTGAAPEYYTLVAGTNMTITSNSGAETITFASTGGGGIPASSCSFFATKSAPSNAVTGDGTVYTVIFDSVMFNNGTDYSSGTGNFTAPANGVYNLATTVTMSFSSVITTCVLAIVTTQSTSEFLFQRQVNTTFSTLSVNSLFPMNLGDTAYVTLTVSGTSSKSIGVYGQNNQSATYFSGMRII